MVGLALNSSSLPQSQRRVCLHLRRMERVIADLVHLSEVDCSGAWSYASTPGSSGVHGGYLVSDAGAGVVRTRT